MAFTELTAIRPTEGYYTSEVHTPRPLPVRTFLPTGYEPRYAYPLLVFSHGHGGNEEQILRLAPRLSRRNYISIGLRGPAPSGPFGGEGSYSWGGARLSAAAGGLPGAGRPADAPDLPRAFRAGFISRVLPKAPASPTAWVWTWPARSRASFHSTVACHGTSARFCGCPRRVPWRVFIGHGTRQCRRAAGPGPPGLPPAFQCRSAGHQ